MGIYSRKIKDISYKPRIDKQCGVCYNIKCVTNGDASNSIVVEVIQIRRNTQEAEEAPLLRV